MGDANITLKQLKKDVEELEERLVKSEHTAASLRQEKVDLSEALRSKDNTVKAMGRTIRIQKKDIEDLAENVIYFQQLSSNRLNEIYERGDDERFHYYRDELIKTQDKLAEVTFELKVAKGEE